MLRAREAAQFLRPRQRRANHIFEETKQGHLERECIEEMCNKEEAREVFENDPETVSERGAPRAGRVHLPCPGRIASRLPLAPAPPRETCPGISGRRRGRCDPEVPVCGAQGLC